MNDSSKPRIVIAAVKKYGVVFTGLRHGHIIRDMVEAGFINDAKKDYVEMKEQGFVDSNNKYWNRADAWQVAFDAGQIEAGHGMLYSEDLW